MIIKNVSWNDLSKALRQINKKYDNNICWNRFDRTGNNFNITLRCVDSKKAGHRLGHRNLDWQTGKEIRKQRRLISACWHVHGDFFEALLELNQRAIIKTNTKTISIDGGNWQDWNIGSVVFPMYYSEACECD